jgi:hypothetical protein
MLLGLLIESTSRSTLHSKLPNPTMFYVTRNNLYILMFDRFEQEYHDNVRLVCTELCFNNGLLDGGLHHALCINSIIYLTEGRFPEPR